MIKDRTVEIRGIKLRLSTPVLLFLIFGSLYTGALLYDYHGQTSTIEDVETVEGVVLDTEYEEQGGRTTDYIPIVTYEYEFNGETYTNDQVFPEGFITRSDGTEGGVQSRLDSYEASNTTTVYVDPDDPDTAVLEKETELRGVQLVAVWVVVLGVIGIAIYNAHRDEQE